MTDTIARAMRFVQFRASTELHRAAVEIQVETISPPCRTHRVFCQNWTLKLTCIIPCSRQTDSLFDKRKFPAPMWVPRAAPLGIPSIISYFWANCLVKGSSARVRFPVNFPVRREMILWGPLIKGPSSVFGFGFPMERGPARRQLRVNSVLALRQPDDCLS